MTDSNAAYPCPTCIGVFSPGVTFTIPASKGAGVVPVWGLMGPSKYVTCQRCEGTGLVSERRDGAADRRQHSEV